MSIPDNKCTNPNSIAHAVSSVYCLMALMAIIGIKSNYILQKVFDNLEKRKTLEIVKNNKNIKKRINLNINDYKEYSEIFTPIEIEIRPAEAPSPTHFTIIFS